MDINNFSISISKQQLAELPLVEFPGEITVVDTLPGVSAALASLRGCEVVGFDTETKPNFRKGQTNTVSLIQISTLDHSYLFRLNKIGLPAELTEFLESNSITKIGLSLKDDFHVLSRLSDFAPGGFIDLQEMVKQYHISDCSLQKIYGIIFSGRISKSQRLSNWEATTLTPGQQAYASIDAWACLRIYNYLTLGEFHPESSPYLQPIEPCE